MSYLINMEFAQCNHLILIYYGGFILESQQVKPIEQHSVDWLHEQLILSGAFKIWQEYSHNGMRYDMLIKHIESGVILGVELKSKDIKKGSQIYAWIQQIQRYEKNARLLFFAFPHLSDRLFKEGPGFKVKHNISNGGYLSAHHNFSTLLGKFGVGEIHYCNNGTEQWIQFAHTGKLIWDSRSPNEINIEAHDTIKAFRERVWNE